VTGGRRLRFVSEDDRMSTEYSIGQYHSNYPDGAEHHWWNQARNGLIYRLLRGLAVPARRVLEVGCGRGVVVDHLRRRGVECDGVELAPVEPFASVREHVRGGVDALELSSDERAAYDVVMLLDVLEHLPEPATFLRALSEAYPNARTFVVTVPARQELWSNYDEHYGHFLRYSMPTLQAMLQRSGLRIASMGYFFHGIYPLAWFLSRLKRDRALALQVPRGAMRLAHRLIGRALLWDARWLPGWLPGMSLYAVCQAPSPAVRPAGQRAAHGPAEPRSGERPA